MWWAAYVAGFLAVVFLAAWNYAEDENAEYAGLTALLGALWPILAPAVVLVLGCYVPWRGMVWVAARLRARLEARRGVAPSKPQEKTRAELLSEVAALKLQLADMEAELKTHQRTLTGIYR